MLLLYCCNPLDPKVVDSDYAAEEVAARRAGFETALISFELLVQDGAPARAVRRVAERATLAPALYRGWMLRPAHYEQLYEALLARGVQLINDPAAYRHTHHLPEWYGLAEGVTPDSVWLPLSGPLDLDAIMALLEPFGADPLILKDYVKSQKHDWEGACYIPSAADQGAVERVVRRFLALQGDDLNEGLVFRRFVPFAPLATHSRSGMPLTREFRCFVLDGAPLFTITYWDEGDYQGLSAPLEAFLPVARAVRSRFFSMDIAQRVDGVWMLVELGDGQVSGLPDHADSDAFYAALRDGSQGLP